MNETTTTSSTDEVIKVATNANSLSMSKEMQEYLEWLEAYCNRPHVMTKGEAILDHAQDILLRYINGKYISYEEEQKYLAYFRRTRATLDKEFNERTPVLFPEEHGYFEDLPERLTIYRGYWEPEKRNGISWSLYQHVAEFFTDHDRNTESLPGFLVTGDCWKKDVLAYTHMIHEAEIIIDPQNVRNIRDIPVTSKPGHTIPYSLAPSANMQD